MTVYYLDSSAWAKRHISEPGSEWMRTFFSRGLRVSCATFGYVEILAALSRRLRAGGIVAAEFDTTRKWVQREYAKFVRVEFGPEVLDLAVSLPATYSLRAADTVHLASALHLRDSLPEEPIIVVCSDAELKAAAAMAGFPVIDPVEEEPK